MFDDDRIDDGAGVRRIVLHSGKLHYELLAEVAKREDATVALVRLEQYYPLPEAELHAIASRYPNAEVVWAQDEPENQGAWPFLRIHLPRLFGGREVAGATRPEASAPSVGTMRQHKAQSQALIAAALD